MPIIYVHGVNTRDSRHSEAVKEYLRRIVAPAISKDPDSVSIVAADWFQFCDPPKWGGISRPRTELLGQGAAEKVLHDEVIGQILSTVAKESSARRDPLTSGQTSRTTLVRLNELDPDTLADLIVLTMGEEEGDVVQKAKIGVAADRVSRDPTVRANLEAATDLDAQLKILVDAVVAARDKGGEPLVAQGATDWYRGMRDRVSEGLSRLSSTPAVAASVLLAELRPELNDLVTRFLGDVFFYLSRRGTPSNPGPIPDVLIKALQAAQVNKTNRDEPIVVLTHSMGGQLVYDAVSSYLPEIDKNIKVDFWCAAASQVGFFEELNLFLASKPEFAKVTGKRTPLPVANLGHWWNVWDHNDILSFTTKGIFENGIDDSEYDTGLSLANAHGGYLERPSFYREFARKLRKAFPDGGSA
ncbi:hypothetical protein AB9F35_20140 [Rhizobium leguminosarum]|uniref:hypothetical protein n=1 Tax=Rhizobium leguminosarum TaxID=384 RepID=UPI003F9B2FA4